jgi:hypothetical protein
MPNTFLNTGRTVAATSNPVNNVNQVSNNPINQTQPVSQPTVNSNTQTNSNAINPITIPIQIQPQIANTTPVENNNIQALQANAQQPVQNRQATSNTAPTPQAYNSNNTNTNVIDFNQIYSSYQNQYGNNNQTSTNGIKKTSIGSTIVTPISNINTIKGQYQSAYSDTINSLISEMLSQMNNGFEYNPNEDEALKLTTEYAANSTMQSLAGSGVLNSSATAERVARIVSELIPQYEEKAHDRWIEYLGQLADTAQLVMNYDSQQFEQWKDAKDREFQEKQFEYQKKQNELENAWKRVDELGYVDNEASKILGVAVGTLSGEARLAKEQREFELQKMREQLEIQYENDKALYELRSELDKEYANYEYQLAQKYNTSSNSNKTSLSTYQSVINNRWADQDLVTGKYSVTDNDAVYNYLTTEYASGRMSSNDLASLTAMYGITVPEPDPQKEARLAYLQSLGG